MYLDSPEELFTEKLLPQPVADLTQRMLIRTSII
jgi:hypothetical protein